MKTILIDGEILKYSPYGGISRIFSSILPIMADSAPEFEFIYRVPPGAYHVPEQIRKHPRIQIFEDWSPPLPLVLRKRLDPLTDRINEYRVNQIDTDIFIPTYYTQPPGEDAEIVVPVYDLIDFALFAGASGNPHGFPERLRHSLETASHLVAISETTKQDIIKFTNVEPHRVTVMPLAPAGAFTNNQKAPDSAAIESFRQKYHIDGSYWLYVGSRAHYKNFDTLLKGWASCEKATRADVGLVVAGWRPQQFMGFPLYAHQMSFLVENKLEKRIQFIEDIDDDTLLLAYAGAHAYVFPSLYEGFSITPLEAMASKIPAVVSDIPVHREVCGDAAIYFDPNSAEDMARAMNMTLDNEMRKSYIEKGMAHVQQFSWEKSAQVMLDLCRQLGGSV